MNRNIIEGKWKEIKGGLMKEWGKITGDEFEQVKGDSTKIAGILEQKYGYKKEEAAAKVDKFLERFTEPEQNKEQH